MRGFVAGGFEKRGVVRRLPRQREHRLLVEALDPCGEPVEGIAAEGGDDDATSKTETGGDQRALRDPDRGGPGRAPSGTAARAAR
jgi:hypothetical protein